MDCEQNLAENGGEGEIRTPGTLARTSHFECDAIDHSATSPHRVAGRSIAEVEASANPFWAATG